MVNQYDALGRLVRRTVDRGDDVEGPVEETYDYDALGNLIEASSDGIITARRYDSLSRLKLETNDGRQSSYVFDDSGNLRNLRYPSGREVAYGANDANQLSSVDLEARRHHPGAKGGLQVPRATGSPEGPGHRALKA